VLHRHEDDPMSPENPTPRTVRRRTLAMLAGLATASAAPLGTANAQPAGDWPSRPVTMINPFAAGSAVDVVARLVAQRMTQNLGQAFNIEYRTGASGNIGTEAAARARPDGYTLLLGSPGTMAINPWLFQKLPYDAVRDFEPIGQVVSFPQVLFVNPKSDVRTVPELIATARSKPDVLTHGSSGQGTTSHLVMELIKADAGLRMTHVAYRGGAPVMQAVAAGEVVVGVEGIPSLLGQVRGGTLRALAVTSPRRSPQLPDVPALAEFLPGFDASAWIILLAPAGTPAPIVARASAELRRALVDPAVREQLESQGATIVGSSPEEAAAFHQGELRKFRRAVETSGAKAE
jgi:tripartite-type tricarboxylate transporter receptor subunit TctC